MMSPWGSVTRKEALRRTSEMARDLACPTGTSTATDRKTLLDCLRNKVSAVQLKDAQEKFENFAIFLLSSDFIYAPKEQIIKWSTTVIAYDS